MEPKPVGAPNTTGRKGPETETSDRSQVRQQKAETGATQSVQTPGGGHEGQGGGEPQGAQPKTPHRGTRHNQSRT